MAWTCFWDMHSGGGLKEEPYDKIYIEAKEEEAKIIFFNRFGHSPDRVSCTCCGDDYSINESNNLKQASAFHRGCAYVYRNPKGEACEESEAWKPGEGLKKGYKSGYEEIPDKRYRFKGYVKLKEYLKNKNILVIYSQDIKPEERKGEVPEQGYVWH